MNNELKVFENPDFGQVRTITRDGEPWFAAADICKALEIGNPSQAIARIDDDEKFTTVISNEGAATGKSSMAFVNEPGLYSLVLGSRKPEAKAFKRWITHEVIPSIRKHGGYLTPERVEDILSNPDTIIQLATQLKQEREKTLKLEASNSELTVQKQIMQPKADYFDELVDRNLLMNFRDTAKVLGVKEREFVNFLVEHGYVYRNKSGNLRPVASKNTGLFEMKECYNEKSKWAGPQTMITPRGRETFRLLCQGLNGGDAR